MKVLLLENIHPVAVETLERHGHEVELRAGSLSEDELVAALDGVDLLGIRSNTTITPRVLDAAGDLLAIGCFCIGTNQVDLAAAAERGVAVFNAPYSNTRSVVELVIGEIIALARRLPEKTAKMHAGVWDKSAAGSHEVRGRTLGIVGYGNIGTQLSNVAEALGLRVIFFDTADRLAHGNARRMPSLDALLAEADVVSLHVDGRPGNAGFFGEAEFAQDEAALAVHQRRPRHGRRRRGAAPSHRGGPHRRRGARRLPRRAEGAGRRVPVRAPRPRQRDPDAARRRLDPGGPGGDRLVRGRQARGVRRRGLDRAVGQPARGAAARARRRAPGSATCTSTSPASSPRSTPTSPTQGDNVVGQYLATRGEQGYVVTDASEPISEAALDKLRSSPHTIWLRTYDA